MKLRTLRTGWKGVQALGVAIAVLSLTGCGTAVQDVGATVRQQVLLEKQPASPVTNALTVHLTDKAGHRLTLQLNDSPAAKSLYAQLPLTTDIENYSTNEKIWYPPQPLDTSRTPLAEPGTTTVAYYEPWGDIVLFYGPYQPNDQLFSLGTVEEGQQAIQAFVPGQIRIEK